MCNLSEVIGSGPVLLQQGLTVISIAASIVFWVWLYRRNGLERQLMLFALPIALWTVLGSLDILITAKGTFENPYREGNQAARFIFVSTGYLGPVIASVLWVALWSGMVLALNKMKMPFCAFVSLAIFYSLAFGHLSGFSSWYLPFCQVAKVIAWSKLPIIIGLGVIASALHLGVHRFLSLRKEK